VLEAALKWTEKDFEGPNVLDIWNFRGKAALMEEGSITITESRG